MKVLYIRRHPKTQDKRFWAAPLYRIRDTFFLNHQDGFFRASLSTHARITVSDLATLQKMSASRVKNYDVVVFHHKCSPLITKEPDFDTLDEEVRNLQKKMSNVPGVLLLANANAKDMPSDKTLDLFQLVFKREHYKDIGRYDLQNHNREKIHGTILSCQLVPSNILNFKQLNITDYGCAEPSVDFNCDVSFVGKDTSRLRREVVDLLIKSDIDFKGGIYKKGGSIPDPIQYPRMSQKKYYEQVRKSRINLAIEGYGQFTYRHWELWALSAFVLSSPSIKELKLPFDAVEGVHYALYDDYGDLIDKINYYLENPQERRRIAQNGRKLFEEEYNFYKHGKYIYDKLRRLTE